LKLSQNLKLIVLLTIQQPLTLAFVQQQEVPMITYFPRSFRVYNQLPGHGPLQIPMEQLDQQVLSLEVFQIPDHRQFPPILLNWVNPLFPGEPKTFQGTTSVHI